MTNPTLEELEALGAEYRALGISRGMEAVVSGACDYERIQAFLDKLIAITPYLMDTAMESLVTS